MMECEYCGKEVPESYSYKVGGTVDCGCRFKKKKEPNNIEAVKFSIALDKANQRIAELEAKLTHNEQTCVPCEVCQRGFHPQFMYNDGGVIRCAHCVIKHERETRVPDELLEWLLSKAHYSAAWGDNYDEAEAILAKRKEAHND